MICETLPKTPSKNIKKCFGNVFTILVIKNVWRDSKPLLSSQRMKTKNGEKMKNICQVLTGY